MSSPHECKAQTPEVSTVLLLESEDFDVNENHIMAQWSAGGASANSCEPSSKPEPEKPETGIEVLNHPTVKAKQLRLLRITAALIFGIMVVAATGDTWVGIIAGIHNAILAILYVLIYLDLPPFGSRHIPLSGAQSV